MSNFDFQQLTKNGALFFNRAGIFKAVGDQKYPFILMWVLRFLSKFFSSHFEHIVQETRAQNGAGKDAKKPEIKSIFNVG